MWSLGSKVRKVLQVCGVVNHLCHMLLIGQVKWEVRTDHLDLARWMLLVTSLRVVLLEQCKCNWSGLKRELGRGSGRRKGAWATLEECLF